MASAPGFIDLQVNGWGGTDFSGSLDQAAFEIACAAIRQTGTSGFLATVITSPDEVYRSNLPLIADAIEAGVQGLLGVHLEGPFFEPRCEALGAHAAEHCRAADAGLLASLQELARGHVRLVTIGADVAGAPELCAAAAKLGIQMSLGHHEASAGQIRACADAGAAALTHLGNGLPLRVHRHDNPLWAGLADERLMVMLIADGHHLPEPALRVLLRMTGPRRLVLVSDAAPIAGLAPGRHRCLGHDVCLEPDGRLHDPSTGYLVGSSASLAQCVAHARSLGELDDALLVTAARDRPLALVEAGGDAPTGS